MMETIYAMALSHMPRMSLSNINMLYTTLGSATAVFENRHNIRDILPDATQRLCDTIKDMDEPLKRAEAEMEFAQKKNIRCLTMQDADYPQRLLECPDAPIVLYFCGNANLNSSRIINIIGTRHCTEYGRDICTHFISDLQRHLPDVLIVSGLAYGIDINAHRAALDNGMQTIGVLAHGLDRIYPSVHRTTAANMARQGGLLTEYMSQTIPDKLNFVRRNRIVAGMCDATIVVESAAKGGALITAELAESYHRDVFAFPGRVYDQYSEGCNRLIKSNRATLIQTADDFLSAMGWETQHSNSPAPLQQELFPELTDDERLIISTLKKVDDKQINQIVVETGLPFSRISSLMFELELKGLVRVLGGARYKLCKRQDNK